MRAVPERERGALDEMKLLLAFVLFSAATALLIPAWPRYLPAILDVTNALPFMAQLAPFDPLPHYANYFATMWLSMPFWVGALGWATLRNPRRVRPKLPTLSMQWLLTSGCLAVFALMRVDDDPDLRMYEIFLSASWSRLFGALSFTVGMATLLVLCANAFVVSPIDFLRTPLLRDTDELPRGW